MKTIGHRTFNEADSNTELHSPFAPVDIRPNEPFSCLVRSRDPNNPFEKELPVWRLSPLGLELKVGKEDTMLTKGLPIDLELRIGKSISYLAGLVVDYSSESFNLQTIGIRLIHRPQERPQAVERRKQKRWICSEQYLPTLCALNPGKFNDYLYFTVKDVSETGLRLVTSLRNKFIVMGMKLDCIASFPLVSQTRFTIKINNLGVVEQQGREFLSIGAEIVDGTERTNEIISQYLLQFGLADSIKELRASNLATPSTKNVVQFGFVKTEGEYREVLNLRRQAYVAVGKLAESVKPEDTADAYDARARIAIGKINGQIVVCARLTFNEVDQKMEQEKYVQWRDDLPRREDVVEVMRLCTHPHFRGSDLLMGMFQFVAISVVQSKRPWIVICATDDVLPLYEKIGFKKIGLQYPHAELNNTVHYILTANVPQAMCGKNVSPIVWNLLWSDVSKYLREYNLLTPDPLMHIRLGLYRLMAPFAKWMSAYLKRPRKTRKTKGALVGTSNQDLTKAA
jgi:predicted GNAT family N-acyltransferase